MTEPLFSIVTVTRNDIKGLRLTDASVARQSCQNLEWIVVDGASTDGTRRRLVHSRAKWVSEPDDGIYDAMNKGLDMASGRYVQFLNSGDRLSGRDVLARAAEALSDADIVYGDAQEMLADGRTIYRPARSRSTLWRGLIARHQAMFFRRETIGTNRFDRRYTLAADYELTVRMIMAGARFRYMPQLICDYESGGVSQTDWPIALAQIARIRTSLGTSGPLTSRLLQAAQFTAWKRRQITRKWIGRLTSAEERWRSQLVEAAQRARR